MIHKKTGGDAAGEPRESADHRFRLQSEFVKSVINLGRVVFAEPAPQTKKADVVEHPRCPTTSAYSVTGPPNQSGCPFLVSDDRCHRDLEMHQTLTTPSIVSHKVEMA